MSIDTLERDLTEIELRDLLDDLTPQQMVNAIRDNIDSDLLLAAVKLRNVTNVGSLVIGAVRNNLNESARNAAKGKIQSGNLSVQDVRDLLRVSTGRSTF